MAAMELSDQLKAKLATLPENPGCYLMRNASSAIIYVGKAINIKNRVRSYFQAQTGHDAKTRRLVREITDLEWIIVGSELEALILEMNLIKRHRPKYNIRLKDDKRYPYIKVHWNEPFPKVTVTRRMAEDGARYFGPYTSAWAVYQTLDTLRRVFPYLTCDREITGKDTRACLYHDIKLCSGPCIGATDEAGYRQMISDLMSFLNGQSEDIVNRLQMGMKTASEELRFEKAAALRDRLTAIQAIIERQKIIFPADYLDSDIVAMARTDGEACVQVFFVRGGKLIGREYFVLEGTEDAASAEVLGQFVKQFYTEAATIPQQVMLPEEIEEARIIAQWLRSSRGAEKVNFVVPSGGQNRELVQMAADNAAATLSALREQWQADSHKQEAALAALQQALGLQSPPNRIECYDISNTQGTAIIGSMVVFERGVPAKKLYRRFNIESVKGAPDDFASMEEMLTRRFRRWQGAKTVETEPGRKPDESFAMLPDLVIIDGGKGQLGRATQVLEQSNLADKIPVVGLAKQREEIFRPGHPDALMLPRHSPALYLVQRIRDEAHRYGITAHRAKRSKLGLASRLDSVSGIGPARRRALLRKFGSIDAIRAASFDELRNIVPEDAARALQQELE